MKYTPSTAAEKNLLRKVARLWGIQTDYLNAFDQPVKAPDASLLHLIESLSGLSVQISSDLEVLRKKAWALKILSLLEPVQVFRGHQIHNIAVYLPQERIHNDLEWKIQLENGTGLREKILLPAKRRVVFLEGKKYLFLKLPLQAEIPVGYHKVELLMDGHPVAKSLVLCAPELQPRAAAPTKAWGAFAPLYGIRSERDWGIGDLTDMEKFQEALFARGASFFGTLPMLASTNEGEGADPSPYSPVSRLFWNEIFLDVEALAQQSPEGQKLLQTEALQTELLRLRGTKTVDYPSVYALKKKILCVLASEFFSSRQMQSSDYQDFLARTPLMEEYAQFRAQGDAGEYQFHLYVQFQMDQALKRLSEKARRQETTALYLDFPVGNSRGGFDGRKFASSFIADLSVGAPPDSIFLGGQNWGFAPFHPRRLREEGYQYFIQCLRQHMRFAGILRLDHIMAFQRLYVIIQGEDAKSGSYLRYHREEFFALLAIEAERAQVQIIGEDLGTVPQSMRQALDENHCLGMWVLPFESGISPSKAIARMRSEVLACLNTHDMVPWAGHMQSRDLELLQELGLVNDKDTLSAKKERGKVLNAWMKDLKLRDKKELLSKLTEMLAQSPAQLVLVNIEDLWGETEPQNIPGTWREYPNWQRRLRLTTQEWMQQKEVSAVLEDLTKFRGRKEKSAPRNTSPLSAEDLYLFNEGRHHRVYKALGAHPGECKGQSGIWFAVWAPSVAAVSVMGDFNLWNSDKNPLQPQGESGIWSGFVAEAQSGQVYKYRLRTPSGEILDKADPFAFACEEPPRTGSRIASLDYAWQDEEWMRARPQAQAHDKAMSIYEVHLGSWKRKPEEGNRSLTYRELAEELPIYVKEMGFTHIELMPIMEHPFYGSWGYQTTGYFAPTSRFGTPQDFMHLIDCLHQAGIGVLLDWVPSHFPEDAFALGRFNGTHLFEHADPRLGFHPDWKSLIFNYGRHEVRSFLISSALFWLDKYHIDGIRVDAVASMLYLDYSRQPGEWIPNKIRGRENLEAIQFLRELNEAVYTSFPDVHMIAEESTSWPKVSAPTYAGGLGFGMKWDMGWMHDTLEYFKKDPIHRTHHQGQLSFRMVYAFSENFVLSISHDEVVYGKGSVLTKMSGDTWQKFANLRTLYAYMYAQPGKKLLFMGCEFGPEKEWSHEASLDWHLLSKNSFERGLSDLVKNLNQLYRSDPCLHELDFSNEGFEWLDASDAANSVFEFFPQKQKG